MAKVTRKDFRELTVSEATIKGHDKWQMCGRKKKSVFGVIVSYIVVL